jgi:carbonic anhydrase
MKKIVNMSFILIMVLGSVSASDKPTHWGYQGEEGPEYWGQLSPGFSLCGDGKNQSPVDLSTGFDLELPELIFQYHGTPVRELNNGHTIMLEVSPGHYLEIPELQQRFDFKQAHFHSPSEHTIDGNSFAMEIHLVHANEDGELAVVGIMFEEGEEDPMLNRIWSFMPEHEGETTESPLTVFEAGVMPPTREYFRYNGSLTTPPCSEGVTWMVLKQHMTASEEQIDRFQQRVGPLTNRPVQPHNARLILN